MQWLMAIDTLGEKVAIAGLWLGLVGILATIVHYLPQTDSEMVRKVVHLGTGNIILLAWWLAIPAWVIEIAAVVFGALALASSLYPLLPSIDSVGRKSLGTFFYAVSIGLLSGYFWPLQLPQYAALGILVMTWGDGLAGLIGRQWGRHPYQVWGMKKSWEGSVAMGITSAIVSLLILLPIQTALPTAIVTAVLVGLVATVLEAFSKLGVDNLTVPIGSAALAYAIGYWMG